MRQEVNCISVFGSTGSIGVQALKVAEQLGLRIHSLTAHSNIGLLLQQAARYKPDRIGVTDANQFQRLKAEASAMGLSAELLAGPDAAVEIAQDGRADRILNSVVGSAGLRISYAALEAGTDIALANKESMVAAGELLTGLSTSRDAAILPVDSEHSAIWQCIWASRGASVEEIMLTASGGPFRIRQSLEGVRPEDALKHPNWSMGRKITVDSATLINKALEVIEARWLFGVNQERIRVIVHPQSIVHSAVRFSDGSVIAQMGLPDMSLPIMAALAYPRRSEAPPESMGELDLVKAGRLDFEDPDVSRFPGVLLGHKALEAGGLAPAVMSAANEAAVGAFLDGEIPFAAIPELCEEAMQQAPRTGKMDLGQVLEADVWARKLVESRCSTWHSSRS